MKHRVFKAKEERRVFGEINEEHHKMFSRGEKEDAVTHCPLFGAAQGLGSVLSLLLLVEDASLGPEPEDS